MYMKCSEYVNLKRQKVNWRLPRTGEEGRGCGVGQIRNPGYRIAFKGKKSVLKLDCGNVAQSCE